MISIMSKIDLHNCDCLDLMATMKDESIDVICIDPPYLYLKGQKLERPFNEHQFFSECKRLLSKDGFIVMFGRGESFYRWNTILADLKFKFKEEVVWDKSYTSSPVAPLSRVHETVAIWSAGGGKINKIKVPYLEMKRHNISGIIQDIKRLKTTFRNTKSLDAVLYFLERNSLVPSGTKHKVSIVVSGGMDDIDRCTSVMQAIQNGMVEKSIVKQQRDHYSTIHPTQKPVRLIERLLALVLPDKPKSEITVADFFGGSFSTMEACHNMGLNGISCEIDEDYFNAGKARIDALKPVQVDLFGYAV